MSQSLARNLIHLIFSTKNRVLCLSRDVRPKLFAYQAGILNTLHCPTIIINGVEDHVHLLFVLSKNVALAKAVEEVKRGSSKWLKTKGAAFAKFQWQSGYGAFSVSPSNLEAVRRYIANQEERHKKQTFQDEFRRFCRRHEVELDERYVWD